MHGWASQSTVKMFQLWSTLVVLFEQNVHSSSNYVSSQNNNNIKKCFWFGKFIFQYADSRWTYCSRIRLLAFHGNLSVIESQNVWTWRKTSSLKLIDQLFAGIHRSILLILWFVLVFSGEKISPIEVDAVLLSHPDIAQAVAFGVPDEKYGEEVRNLYAEVNVIAVDHILRVCEFLILGSTWHFVFFTCR